MADLRTIIQEEYSDIKFNVEATRIISLYKKQRRKKAAIISSSFFCFLIMVTAVVRLNPNAVESFINSTQGLLSSLFSTAEITSEFTEATVNTQTHSSNPDTDKKDTTHSQNSEQKTKQTDTTEQIHKAVLPTKQIVVDEKSPKASIQPTTEASEANDKIRYEVLADGGIRINYLVPTGKKIVIPKMLEGHKVTTIGKGLFEGYYNITEVELPDTVTEIEAQAFKGLKELVSVKSPNVKIIAAEAFMGCRALKETDLKNVRTIGGAAFKNCDSLINIQLPKSLEEMGERAFESCNKLETVAINSTYKYGSYAFANCASLKKVSFLNGAASVNSYSFYSCKLLNNVSLPDSLSSIGKAAFMYCSSIKEIKLPKGLNAIGKEAFFGCKCLDSITIPSSVAQLGEKCFENRKGFTIRGYDGTAAKSYAVNNGIAFESLGKPKIETKVSLESHIKTMKAGEKYELEYSVDSPVGDTHFKSSDNNVAAVDITGVITALKPGIAEITVTNNGASADFIVIVK